MVRIVAVRVLVIALLVNIPLQLSGAMADATEDIHTLEEMAVTGTRIQKDTYETPRAMSVATKEEIRRRSPVTADAILREETGVQLQKTTYGQGSPIIRGLTGYHTLIMIDGVRLNNSTFRSGPNQYMATVDPGYVERIELVRGPGSVLYGSSAMGGVINVITHVPAIRAMEMVN